MHSSSKQTQDAVVLDDVSSKHGKLKGVRILVVEDHAPLQLALAHLFEGVAAQVDFASNAAQGLSLVLAHHFDVIVLDVGLPGRDGIHLLRDIRARANRHIPVLMLTARDQLSDKIAGFEAGADDYLTKPFANAELLARCYALTLRNQSNRESVLRIGSLCIDQRDSSVRRFDQPVSLHRIATQLLILLALAFPRTLSRSEIIAALWPDETPPSDPLRSHLYLLRQALAQAALAAGRTDSVDPICTVQLVGLKLINDEKA
jgi:DNA-binding response OmpR family regulator